MTTVRKGTGLHTISRIPTIADGMGSLIDFSFDIGGKRTYKGDSATFLEAKCPDSIFKLSVPKLLFKNEAQTPGVDSSAVLKGSLAVSCTPQD